MPAVVIKAFGGMRPLVEPHLLDPSEAVRSENTRLISGGLEPLRGTNTLKACTTSLPATIWRYGNSSTETNWWFEFAVDTDVIRSPIAADPWGRAYWTDGVSPRYAPSTLLLSGSSYPGGSYKLGIPAPNVAPTVTFTAGSGSTAETRSYVYTYVSAYGEEGPPSPPSTPSSMNPAAAVDLSAMATGPAGAYNIATKRIYRTSTVGSSAQFQFVAEIPVATATYSDTVTQSALGEVLPSVDWVAPPDGLRGLKLMANGGAIGFVGNTAYMSEPNLPHAWPSRVAIEEPIVGVGIFRQGAVLLTNSHPQMLTGADPAAMTPERMERPLACLSKRSIVDTEDGCLYASTEGLAQVTSAGIDVVTRKLLSREQWQSYNPSSMLGAYVDGKYHCLFQRLDGTRGTLIFDFSGQGAAMSTCTINAATAVTAVYADPRSSTLYMAQGGNIVRHDRGSNLTMVRRSGDYIIPSACNMACAMVDAEAYPVTARIYADGSLVHTATVNSPFAYRLPAGFERRRWAMEVEGSSKITRCGFATTIAELKAAP